MGMFDKLCEELPLFSQCCTHMHSKKKEKLIAHNRERVIPFALLRMKLFNPAYEINKSTDEMTRHLGNIAASAMLQELRDETKATSDYLSSIQCKSSWGKTSMQSDKAGLRNIAVNDPAESSFGGATRQLQHFGRVGLTNAGGVDQVKRNGDMSNGF